MMNVVRRLTRVMLGVAVALLAACGHDSPTQPDSHEETLQPPVQGVLTVRVTTPHTDDAALFVTVSGAAISNVTAPSGLLLHLRQRGDTITAALFGRIASGDVLHFTVPDVNAAAHYTARIVQVADSANAVRGELAGYGVTVGK